MVARFGDSEEPRLLWRVAAALNDKGDVRRKLGDFPAAIAAYDEVLARFGDSNELRLRWRVAAALDGKGDARKKLGDFPAAIAAYDEVVARFGDSEEPNLQWWVATALNEKGMRQIEIGLTKEALKACEELERRLGTLLTGDKEINLFTWRAMCVRTKALLIQKEYRAAMDAFRIAYAAFVPANTTTMWEMLRLVPDLIATGASTHDLVEVLSSDSTKSGMLVPLLVALREYGGAKVCVPEEVREVVADIRERIKARVAEGEPWNQHGL